MTHSSSLVTRYCSLEPRTRKNLSKDMDFYYFPKSIQQTFKTINHPRTICQRIWIIITHEKSIQQT